MDEHASNYTAEDDFRTIVDSERDILEETLKICERHNIECYAAYGTLLGTIRHKGFIPWDDDVDLNMPLNEIERFLVYARQELPPQMYVDEAFSPERKPMYSPETTRIAHRGIRLINRSGTVFPLGIDIIPLLGMPDHTILRRIHYVRLMLDRYLLRMSLPEVIGKKELTNQSPLRRLVIRLVTSMHLDKLISYERRQRKSIEHMRRYAYDGSRYVMAYPGLTIREIVPKDVFSYNTQEARTQKFEGLRIRVPEDSEHLLTQIYGDYMTPPPESERHSHAMSIFRGGGGAIMMKFTLLIATLNRPKELTASVQALLAQSYQDFEIIIVDQSEEENRAIAQMDERIRYLHIHERGLSHARNIGLAYATGDYVCLVDDDGLYTPNVLETASRILETRKSAILGGLLRDPATGACSKVHRDHVLTWTEAFRFTGSFGMIISREFLSSHLFDEQFGIGGPYGAGEETDVVFAALREGLEVYYTNQYEVLHTISGGDVELTEKKKKYAYGKGALCRKVYERYSRLWGLYHIAWTCLGNLAVGCVYLFGKPKLARQRIEKAGILWQGFRGYKKG